MSFWHCKYLYLSLWHMPDSNTCKADVIVQVWHVKWLFSIDPSIWFHYTAWGGIYIAMIYLHLNPHSVPPVYDRHAKIGLHAVWGCASFWKLLFSHVKYFSRLSAHIPHDFITVLLLLESLLHMNYCLVQCLCDSVWWKSESRRLTFNPIFPGELGLKLAWYLFKLNIADIL